MRILCTGASGLIGSHIVNALVDKHEVYTISKTNRNENSKASNCYLDLRDKDAAQKVISEIEPEIVVHCAANAAEGLSTFSPIEITTSNYDTFWNVLVPSINTGSLKRFVFTSSIAVYGAIHVPFREADLPLPQDIYGVTKLAIEQSLRIMSDIHGFEYTITRPHNVYGENQRMDDPYRNVIALWMNSILKNEPYTIYGDGSMKRCYSYVRDVVDVILKSAFEDVAGMVFNVGSENFYSLNDVSDMVQKIAGVNIKPKYLPTRVHEVHSAISDHTLVRKVLGYNDTPIEEGLQNMWEYAKRQGAQEHVYTKPEIISEHLPKNWR